MDDKVKKAIGIGGAVAIAIGTVGMLLSGADAGAASGIVGLAAAGFAAIVALVGAFIKK